MLSIKIEKEIKHENKVVGGLTLRQLVCTSIGVIACVALFVITRIDWTQLTIVWMMIAIICGAFGWVKKDGMYLESIVMRRLSKLVYHSDRIRYRTVNSYVRLMNEGYAMRRLKNPKKGKPKKAKSKLKGYM